ncbi:hypothetical protein [Halorarius halobius]|uniref:hypothetical protein n=1 Tax=Halorarius halobius TaxID=2962671 RepID=UPI0020CDDA98|nr:hypothetical protein [Halorarius halobius]
MIGPKPEEMYGPTRRAIEDAFWDVLGTVAYGLLLCLVVLVGLQMVVLTLVFGGADPVSVGLLAVGGLAVAGSVYELHLTFDLRQGIRRERRGR